MSKELEEILEIVQDLKKKPKWPQWLVPALISATVSLIVAGIAFSGTNRELKNEMILERAKMKQVIIEKAKTSDFDIAITILDFSLKDLYPKSSDEFERFKTKYMEISGVTIDKFLGTEESDTEKGTKDLDAAILPEQQKRVNNADINSLVDKLDTDDRYAASRELIKKYSEDSQTITTTLIDSIRNNNGYRQNLYVAYILSKIPDRWTGTQDQFEKICKLRENDNYKDATFKKRVERAINNYKNENGESVECSSNSRWKLELDVPDEFQ